MGDQQIRVWFTGSVGLTLPPELPKSAGGLWLALAINIKEVTVSHSSKSTWAQRANRDSYVAILSIKLCRQRPSK